MGFQTVFSLNCWKLEFEIAMHPFVEKRVSKGVVVCLRFTIICTLFP